MLDSPKPVYRAEAYKALKRISNQDFGADSKRWSEWWRAANRR
jgi:hypothetical protein